MRAYAVLLWTGDGSAALYSGDNLYLPVRYRRSVVNINVWRIEEEEDYNRD